MDVNDFEQLIQSYLIIMPGKFPSKNDLGQLVVLVFNKNVFVVLVWVETFIFSLVENMFVSLSRTKIKYF